MAKKKTVRERTHSSSGTATKKTTPAKPKSPEEGGVVALPVDREFPPGQVGVLANHFVIQHHGPEFHLLFFQTHPPIVLGETEEERRQILEETKSVKSVCVARIIVSAERLPSFITAMQENLERYGRQQDVDTKQPEKGA